MTPKPSQTDLSIKSCDKNSARNGLPSAAAKLTSPLKFAYFRNLHTYHNISHVNITSGADCPCLSLINKPGFGQIE